MNSIRNKLFLRLGILIIFFVATIILANSFLLEAYYTYQKKEELIDYYNLINNMPASSYAEQLNAFVDIESTANIDILIRDKSGDIIYTSNGYMLDERFRPEGMRPPDAAAELSSASSPAEPTMNPESAKASENPLSESDDALAGKKPPIPEFKEKVIDDKIKFIWAQDDFNDAINLLLEGDLDNAYNIRMRLPLTSIDSSLKIVNQFILIIGCITFVLAMAVAYWMAKAFTKPIMEMNLVTSHLKKLNFDEVCKTNSRDEIGQLAESINEMAVELKANVESLNIRNEELREEIIQKENINNKRQQLLQNVSHELKTPLALMQGYAEGLAMNIARDKDRANFYCEVIMDETRKMDKLVEGLLSINQLEFGDDPPQPKPFDLSRLISYVAKKYEAIFKEKDVQCTILTPERAMAFADDFRTEQILTNYINNAIAYMDDRREMQISVETSEQHWRVCVTNSGPEIPEAELEKIWDSFYKIDRARTREKGGHGLGLSIVRAIQQAEHNAFGAANVENGICFYFEIDMLEETEN